MISENRMYSFLPDAKKVGEEISNIYEKCKEKRIVSNVSEFVEKIGVSSNSFYKWKRGECFPDIETLQKIVNTLEREKTIDEILIPEANINYDYKLYPQVLKLDFKCGKDKSGEVVVENIEEILNQIGLYKEHCEIINYLNQKEVFSFDSGIENELSENLDYYIQKIEKRYGSDYRFNKKKHKYILWFLEKEKILDYNYSLFRRYYFDNYSEKKNISRIGYIYDNSIFDTFLCCYRMCKCTNLDYKIKIFNLLGDLSKVVIFLTLSLLYYNSNKEFIDYCCSWKPFFRELYEYSQEQMEEDYASKIYDSINRDILNGELREEDKNAQKTILTFLGVDNVTEKDIIEYVASCSYIEGVVYQLFVKNDCLESFVEDYYE